MIPQYLELLNLGRLQIVSLTDLPDLDKFAARAAGDQVSGITEFNLSFLSNR